MEAKLGHMGTVIGVIWGQESDSGICLMLGCMVPVLFKEKSEKIEKFPLLGLESPLSGHASISNDT